MFSWLPVRRVLVRCSSRAKARQHTLDWAATTAMTMAALYRRRWQVVCGGWRRPVAGYHLGWIAWPCESGSPAAGQLL